MKLPITVSILSWRSPIALRNTLESYRDNGLFDLVSEVIIFFQEMTDTDRDIAEEFDITYIIQASHNIGIGRAFTELCKSASNPYVLLIEEDWLLIEPKWAVEEQLFDGIELLDFDIDMVKYRSRHNPGDPLYSRVYQGRELADDGMHLLESIHWNSQPDISFPEYITKRELCHNWYIAPSHKAMHTNNPSMFRKDFYLNHISPMSGEGIDLEGHIIPYWRSHDFKVAHSKGLFKHERNLREH